MATNCKAMMTDLVRNLTQKDSSGKSPDLLSLPPEILEKIVDWTRAGENDEIKLGKEAVKFGKICAYTHSMTHKNKKIDQLIVKASIESARLQRVPQHHCGMVGMFH